MAPAAKSAAFEKAVDESRKLKTKPTQDELLEVKDIDIFFIFFYFYFLSFSFSSRSEGRKESRKGF